MKIRWLGKQRIRPVNLLPGDTLTCIWPTNKGPKSFTKEATIQCEINKIGVFEAEDWEGFKSGIGGFFGEEECDKSSTLINKCKAIDTKGRP